MSKTAQYCSQRKSNFVAVFPQSGRHSKTLEISTTPSGVYFSSPEKENDVMNATERARFVHRANRDTFDSICRGCFRTVGTQLSESDLKQDEGRHRCSNTSEREDLIRWTCVLSPQKETFEDKLSPHLPFSMKN